jgi:hypothetical protein
MTGREYIPDDFSGGLDSKCFKILWDAGFEIIFKTDNQPLAEEILPSETYIEGAVRQVLTNADAPDARQVPTTPIVRLSLPNGLPCKSAETP